MCNIEIFINKIWYIILLNNIELTSERIDDNSRGRTKLLNYSSSYLARNLTLTIKSDEYLVVEMFWMFNPERIYFCYKNTNKWFLKFILLRKDFSACD